MHTYERSNYCCNPYFEGGGRCVYSPGLLNCIDGMTSEQLLLFVVGVLAISIVSMMLCLIGCSKLIRNRQIADIDRKMARFEEEQKKRIREEWEKNLIRLENKKNLRSSEVEPLY